VTAADIAAALGMPQREGRGWRCRCRCPIHGGKSLVLRDGREGRLLVRCWGGGCDLRDILAELQGQLVSSVTTATASEQHPRRNACTALAILVLARWNCFGLAASASSSAAFARPPIC
jgi:hypothetical protein